MVVLDLGSNNLCFPCPLSFPASHQLGTIPTDQVPPHTLSPVNGRWGLPMWPVSESSLPGRTVLFGRHWVPGEEQQRLQRLVLKMPLVCWILPG